MVLPISRSVHVSEVITEIKEARINFCPFVIELEIISFASCHRVRTSVQLQRQLSISFWSRIFEIDFTARFFVQLLYHGYITKAIYFKIHQRHNFNVVDFLLKILPHCDINQFPILLEIYNDISITIRI